MADLWFSNCPSYEVCNRPGTWQELTTSLANPTEDVVKALNQLIRVGFVGIHPSSNNREIRFHWAQTAAGEPALRDA
jgi:hypothetical protein